ncbi:phosphatidylethanolamine N-methyltransferase [Scheffersomyces spartinae]|uniref:Phosphatidylethanolamine N-methyltransferase n=1 Tax=Scheffersomyces spartinae TaxID=45513 RepID=A0A9P8AJD7_9ASCO|nr:phosphatidylethanolamine N-methyltransferase [Scheffersomyces spartinae]KAG7195343.1 phosphatidylethanolamine N-methyltransferase [Scheffersomyces spartinae]
MTTKSSSSSSAVNVEKQSLSSTEAPLLFTAKRMTTGVTFSGTQFEVPTTHDMLHALFNPGIRKSHLEKAIVVSLAMNFVLFYFLPLGSTLQLSSFVTFYLFWRFAYNFGIGYLLRQQSLNNQLVKWANNLDLFSIKSSKDLSPASPTLIQKLAAWELTSQMKDYPKYPAEFNTWLLFRKLVDLILMQDFVLFVCVFILASCSDNFQFINTNQQGIWLVASRLIIGTVLIVFNYWVKSNAHYIIKDYAWYWGDFFFRQFNNEELIFDGVFEMVPHPMYSIGYIGYYGFALIAKSYTVLMIAIVGHFLQMVFLHIIENPHIDRIYGPTRNELNSVRLSKFKDLKYFDNFTPLVGLLNFNLFRPSDVINLLLVVTYGLVFPFVSKSTSTLFKLAIATKLIESVGVDIVLWLQHHFKYYTKWILANDIPLEKSLNNFAIIYNTLLNVSYATVFGLNLCQWLSGSPTKYIVFLSSEWLFLRILVGGFLIATQVLINVSIIDSIGYFGWFYGDFFIPAHQNLLTKCGVYRYLNNPEQIFGVCGLMGTFLIFPSFENFILTLIWVVNNFVRFNFIERTHMIQVYGESAVSTDSGVTKTFKKHLIPNLVRRGSSPLTFSNPTTNGVQGKRRSTFSESLDVFLKELRKSKNKLSNQNMIEISQNLNFSNGDYSIKLESPISIIGHPITIEWHSPEETHSPLDWIGLYKVVQTSYSKYHTLILSQGRWTYLDKSKGTFTFSGSKLFWEEGIYEFRYHLDGKHDVTCISSPFEIRNAHIQIQGDSEGASSQSEDESEDTIEVRVANALQKEILQYLEASSELKSFDIDEPIKFNEDEDVVKTLKLVSRLVSQSTGIKLSHKYFAHRVGTLTTRELARKLIEMQRVLNNLSEDFNKRLE